MAEPNGNGAPPVANRPVVQGELKRALASRHRNPAGAVLLLRAAPEWRGDTEFDVDIEGSRLAVTVAPCPTVLAVLDAMAARREPGRYLVVLTPREPHEVGESVLARAMLPEVKPINRWDLVRDAFGARALDESLSRRDSRWIAEALLDAQPTGGWRRLSGPVLSRATALNRLAAIRLGIDAADDSAVDGAALLQWTADPAAIASFLRLRAEERDGLIGWLTDTTGGVAEVVFAMAGVGKIPDAIPVALAVAALNGQPEHGQPEYDRPHGEVLTSRVRAEERYFGGRPLGPAALRAFWEAAESLVTRWAGNGHADQAAACCADAEAILAELGAPEVARDSRVLQAGMDARLAALAAALGDFLSGPPMVPGALARADEALRRILDHAGQRGRAAEVSAAEAAVRVARWLALPEAEPATPADAATRLLRSWSWADRALAILPRADTSRVPELADAYAALRTQGTARRASLDEAFARRLATSTAATAGPAAPDGALLVENILGRIARPVAAQRPPVIVVLDGMSVAVAAELAEEIAEAGRWLEAGRFADGREPALAMVSSATVIPRVTLLTGKPGGGGEAEERAGFTAFWGRRPSVLFHTADLTPEPDKAMADRVRDALLDQGTIVGVVLDAVARSLDDVTYLRPILDEARRASRPVIITVGPGGGTAPSEAVVPVLTLLPGDDTLLPPDWTTYDAVGHAPAWWEAPSARRQVAQPEKPEPGSSRRKRPVAPPPDDAGALFGVTEVMSAGGTLGTEGGADETTPVTAAAPRGVSAARSLGARVVASPRMVGQRAFLRRAPDDASVAALINGLVRAGGRLTMTEAAAAADEHAVRMSGYLTQVGRLLNLDGYAVLQVADGGKTVTLDHRLLRQQFLGE